MPPDISGSNLHVNNEIKDGIKGDYENILLSSNTESKQVVWKRNAFEEYFQFKTKLIWTNIILLIIFHIIGAYSLLTFPYTSHGRTVLWTVLVGWVGGFGVTAGAHRYYTHRSFKAKVPLQIILICSFYAAGQNSLYNWIRDHRVHHKYTETDADPHNSERGFFYSHIGWLMMKKHPEVTRRGQQVDMSDFENDPLVSTIDKYYLPLKILLSFVLPVLIPVFFWNETWKIAIMSQVIRYMLLLNSTWSVNSFAHIYGTRPYEKNIKPVENIWVSLATHGEGWHNYHHVFPWDYKASEFGFYHANMTAAFIDFFAEIGWAYDLKEPSKQIIRRYIQKKGDGSHFLLHELPEENDD